MSIVECGILDLDSASDNRTHSIAYFKNKDKIVYFDSFSNSPSLIELQK